MEIRVRNARLNEAKEIYNKLLKKPFRGAYTSELLKDLIKNKLSICLVAILDNKIIASLGARREGYKAYWLYFVEVGKKSRNKGVGKALINGFFKKAKKFGVEKIACDCPNKKFLLKFGFRQVGRLPKWQAKNRDQFIMFREL